MSYSKLGYRYALLNDNPLGLYIACSDGVRIYSGSLIDRLNDLSRRGDANRTAAQNTPANMFSYTASDSDFRGRGSITTGTIGRMNTGVWSNAVPAVTTHYYVCKVPNSTQLGLLMDGPNATNRQTIYTQNGQIYGFTPNTSINSTTARADQVVVACIVFNGASSAVYVNNMTTPDGSGNLPASSMPSLVFGQYHASNNYPFNSTFAVAGLFAGAHDLTTRLRIGQSLGQDYGVTIT